MNSTNCFALGSVWKDSLCLDKPKSPKSFFHLVHLLIYLLIIDLPS
jgi:hypothetical protein